MTAQEKIQEALKAQGIDLDLGEIHKLAELKKAQEARKEALIAKKAEEAGMTIEEYRAHEAKQKEERERRAKLTASEKQEEWRWNVAKAFKFWNDNHGPEEQISHKAKKYVVA